MRSNEERMRLALEKIMELTNGYDQYSIPEVWGANVIAKTALDIDTSDIVCNHDDEVFHPETCKACKLVRDRWFNH